MQALIALVIACTTFLAPAEKGFLVGKSYDWNDGRGRVLHNKAGMRKRALVLEASAQPAEWTSKYASLTFNQYGRELPNGGMNEAGLVIEIMWLDASRYPPPDLRPTVNELQWIQYQLDRFATVAEVVAHAPTVRVAPVRGAVHYLACDRSGACAAFEHLGGALEIFTGERLPAAVLTNDTVPDSAAYLRRHSGFGGKQPVQSGTASLDRFARAAQASRAPSSVPQAFSTLEAVGQGEYSQWNIVYDPVRLEVHFRTLAATAIKTVKLRDFDRRCSSPVVGLDIDHQGTGDIGKAFRPYTTADNKALLDGTMKAMELPAFLIAAAAHYPETTTCATAVGR